MHHYIWVYWDQLDANCLVLFYYRHGVEQVNSHVHLPVSSACTLYVAPENGCILHPKHVEQKV